MPSVRRNQVTVRTNDGFPLVATRFDPPPEIATRAVVVIGSATGVYAKLYHDFATYVSS